MFCIFSPFHNPYFNLAAEEYLFENFTDNVFFLYVNTPAVVVGKHQNALAEINPAFVRKNRIDVVRRLSGGGAVYHDLGNLNFSFHQTVNDTSKISFRIFNCPVVEVLHQFDVPAGISQRNDILVNGYKVSGHAEHVFRNRILSHGTLLFNTNREQLTMALKNRPGSFNDKAIRSVRSKVANVSEFLKSPLTIKQFKQQLFEYILEKNHGWQYELTKHDYAEIQKLVTEKYATWEWNFGYSPKYRFEKQTSFGGTSMGISIFVEKGLMKEVKITGGLLTEQEKRNVQGALLDTPHEFGSIVKILSTLNLEEQVRSKVARCFF